MTATEERILWEALHRYDDRDWQGANLEHLPALVAPRIALVMNEDELDLWAISPDTPIKNPPPPGRLINRLRLVLEPLELTVHVSAGTLVVMSRDAAEDETMARIYDVSPVLVEVIDGTTGQRAVDWRSLKLAIQENVAPDSWLEQGGTCVARPLEIPGRRLLVVSAPLVTHLTLTDMLQSLVASANPSYVSQPGTFTRVTLHNAAYSGFQSPQVLHAPQFQEPHQSNHLPRGYEHIPNPILP